MDRANRDRRLGGAVGVLRSDKRLILSPAAALEACGELTERHRPERDCTSETTIASAPSVARTGMYHGMLSTFAWIWKT